MLLTLDGNIESHWLVSLPPRIVLRSSQGISSTININNQLQLRIVNDLFPLLQLVVLALMDDCHVHVVCRGEGIDTSESRQKMGAD